jgi:hypothetical protein
MELVPDGASARDALPDPCSMRLAHGATGFARRNIDARTFAAELIASSMFQ